MKTMNLNAAGVMELDAVEMREIDGGWIKEAVAAVVDIVENWDKYVAAFKEGFAAGQKSSLRFNAMKENLNSGLFTDLTNQEMVELNGGSAVGVAVAKALGFVFGAIAKIQQYSGDNGQWLA